jgi:hypothetical protein
MLLEVVDSALSNTEFSRLGLHKERKAKENRERRMLEKEFNTPLPETTLPFPGNTEHTFDLVSRDRKIIGEIKTSEPNKMRKTDTLRSATYGDLCTDCLLLLYPRRAMHRLLIPTDNTVLERFVKSRYGQVAEAKGIDICPPKPRTHNST